MSEPRKRKAKPFILEALNPNQQWLPVENGKFLSTANAIAWATKNSDGKFRVIQVCDEFTVAVEKVEKRTITR